MNSSTVRVGMVCCTSGHHKERGSGVCVYGWCMWVARGGRGVCVDLAVAFFSLVSLFLASLRQRRKPTRPHLNTHHRHAHFFFSPSLPFFFFFFFFFVFSNFIDDAGRPGFLELYGFDANTQILRKPVSLVQR
jgi:hypothetical protein